MGPDHRGSRANAVSYDGSVVSGWESWNDTFYRRAAYWTADTPGDPFSTYTETYLGSPWYDPDPVNGAGEVLAMTSDGSSMSGDTHYGDDPQYPGGFHWSATEGFKDIEAIQDDWGVWPQAMSDDGSVVVGTMGPPPIPLRLAFIWTEDTGTMLLEQRLNSLGADIGDFTYLGYANDISADGQIIIGSSPAEGSWKITLPGEADPGVAGRAGTGTLIVEDGLPLHLPVVPAPARRPQPVFETIEKSVPKNDTGAIEFGSN
jgi:uncharacterized membrane protein